MTSGTTVDATRSGIPPPRRRLRDPATALIAVAVLLPVVLFGLAAWQGYRDALREAESRADRTARVLEEHALKVFETNRLVIQQVNERIRFVDWGRADHRADLSRMLKRLTAELKQIAVVTITDRDGKLRVSNQTDSSETDLSFGDRDWFQFLKSADRSLPYVSRSYKGRQARIAIFNVAGRIEPRPGEAFAGAVNVAVDRGYFERFYESVETQFSYSVLLVREDGQVLARVPRSSHDTLPLHSTMRRRMELGTAGSYIGSTRMDGIERIFAYRRVGAYPVFVRFGVTKSAALAPWRASLLTYGLVAALASLALVGVSLLALRQTDRERLARRHLEEAAAALRREAGERTRVEDQLRQSQKMEALGRLTGGVAHDFNNLLTAVIGSLDLVRRRKTEVDPRALDLVGHALEGAHRAAALTSRLLTFSRQQPLKSIPVDANAVVTGMSELLRRTLGETVIIKTRLGDGLWPTASDPNQLENALLNLAVNARDAMPGGGTLTIETAKSTVGSGERADVAPGDYVVIGVADTGTGMLPDVLAKVFEPFFTTKPTGQGTGLGLAQVYGFVRQCGGQVDVRSQVGHGTRFDILLPRLEAAVRQPGPPEPRTPAVACRGRGETILVVEDEPMVLRLSIAILEEAGYRVLCATDGRSALDRFRSEPDVALLFTDVVLGGAMNGRVLADAVLKESPGLPVLFTSGYTGDALVHDGRLDQSVNLLAKPFSGEALAERVAGLIAQHERGKALLPAL